MDRFTRETNQDLPVSCRLFETPLMIGATTPALSETNDTPTSCSSPKSFPIDRSDPETYRIPANECGRDEVEHKTYRTGHQSPTKRPYFLETLQLSRGIPSNSESILAQYSAADTTFEEHGRLPLRQVEYFYDPNQPGSQRATHPQPTQAPQQTHVAAMSANNSEAGKYSFNYSQYPQRPATQGPSSYQTIHTAYYSNVAQGPLNSPAIAENTSRNTGVTANTRAKRKSEELSDGAPSPKRLNDLTTAHTGQQNPGQDSYGQTTQYPSIPQALPGQRSNNLPDGQPPWYGDHGTVSEPAAVGRSGPYSYNPSPIYDTSGSAGSAYPPPVAGPMAQASVAYASGEQHASLAQTNNPTSDDLRPHLCSDCPKSFRQKADLNRHRVSVHEGEGQRYFCPTLECATSQKTFARRDNLLDHLKRVHKLPTDDKDQVTKVLNAGKKQ